MPLLPRHQRPRTVPLAGIAFSIAAFVALGAESAAAQYRDCFLVFCRDRPDPYARPDGPQWQRDPQWQREPYSQQEQQWRREPRWQEEQQRQREPDWQREPEYQPRPGWREPPPEPYRPYESAPQALGRDFPYYSRIYAEATGEPHFVAALELSDVDPAFLRRSVHYPIDEAPGTIVIDPQRHFLYFIEGGGRAIRYGVGVGRTGFGWSGVATVHNKQAWPDWYPPKEMIWRQPEIRAKMSEMPGGLGMPGGPRNPLGARALYLWQGNKDTLYRIHGTVEPWTIGHNVSSGCIRMINQDVIDLYERAPVGAKVVVLSSRETAALQ
jgi:lipoprotein-anchoring transpeptidase ErfK/SrfK